MTNAYDYVDSVLIYMDGYDRALTSSGLVNLSADDYSGWYSVYSSMSDTERTCIAPVVVNAGKASERRQLVVCARMMTMEGLCGRYPEHQPLAGNDCRAAPVR